MAHPLLLVLGYLMHGLAAHNSTRLRWAYEAAAPQGISYSPAVGPNETVWFGSYDTVYALTALGATHCTAQLPKMYGNTVASAPAVGENAIYFGARESTTDQGYLVAFSLDCETLLWIYYVSGSIIYGPYMGANGNIVVVSQHPPPGTVCDTVHVVSPYGAKVWSKLLDSACGLQGGVSRLTSQLGISAQDGAIYGMVGQKVLCGLDAATGAMIDYQVVERGTTDSIAAGPAMSDDGVVYVGGTATNPVRHYLYAFARTTNSTGASTLKWQCLLDDAVSSTPSLSPLDGTIYVLGESIPGSTSSRLYAINKDQSGGGMCKEAWEGGAQPTVAASLSTNPVVSLDGTTVYVSLQDHSVYALNRSGSVLWTYETGGAVAASPALSADGATLYVGSQDTYLYALSTAQGPPLPPPPPPNPWPTFASAAALAASPWSEYFQIVYGSLPTTFPLSVGALWLLYDQALVSAKVGGLPSAASCPQMEWDRYTSNDMYQPPLVSWIWHAYPYHPLAANTYVEVVHDSDPFGDEAFGMWMLYTPGSGIYFDLGNTIAFAEHEDAYSFFNVAPGQDMNEAMSKAAVAAGYDSVQFLAHVDHVSYVCDTVNTGRVGFDYLGLEIVAVGLSGTYPCGTPTGAPPSIKKGWGGNQLCHCDPKKQFLNCDLP